MSKLAMVTRSPLAGFQQQIGSTAINEITDLSIVSVAVTPGGSATLIDRHGAQVIPKLPAPGQFVQAEDQHTRWLGVQPDQWLVLIDGYASNALPTMRAWVGDNAYLVDQSDSWAVLGIDGPTAREALERICPLDLHADIFLEGMVSRTSMEHMTTIIVRESVDGFILLSPASSANSFLHAVMTSLHNVQ